MSRAKNGLKAGFRRLGLDLRRYHRTMPPETRMERLRHAVFSRLGISTRQTMEPLWSSSRLTSGG
jgi:hypothetical protein